MKKKICFILFFCLLMAIYATAFMKPVKAKESITTVVGGSHDRLSIFDGNKKYIKNIKIAISNKSIIASTNYYKKSGVNRVSILVKSQSSDATASSIITIKYYNKNTKTNGVKKVKVIFKKDFNHGVKNNIIVEKGNLSTIKIKNSQAIKDSNIDYGYLNKHDFDYTMAGSSKSDVCSISVNNSKKVITIKSKNYGLAIAYINVHFQNGEEYHYILQVNSLNKEGYHYHINQKVFEGKGTILYYNMFKNAKVTVDVKDKSVASATLQEKKDGDFKKVALIIKGEKVGDTDIVFTYKDDTKTIKYKYTIEVEKQQKNEVEVLKPSKVNNYYFIKYDLSDEFGNSFYSNNELEDYINITPNSNQVHVWRDSITSLYIDTEGDYEVEVVMKDLNGKEVNRYTKKIKAENLVYGDEKQITFSTKEEAEKFFAGDKNKKWDNKEGDVLELYKNHEVHAFNAEAGSPWFIRYEDMAEGQATYDIDIIKQIIIVHDYEQTITIPYQIISENRIRLTIEGRTLEYILDK